MKPIKLYWCRGRGRSDESQQNFGDYLSADLVGLFSGRNVVHAPVQNADMIAVGSVLGREKKAKRWGFSRTLHIWGTGSGDEVAEYSGHHQYHAVRGLRTKAQIKGLKGSPVLGDPGLLAPWLINKPPKKIRVGVVPHFSHHNTPEIDALLKMIPGSRMINVFSPVKQVLEEIASCDFVLSTSMHGLIVADSFGVPNQWIWLGRDSIGHFKFSDYYSSYGLFGQSPVSVKDMLKEGIWDVDSYMESYHRPGLEAMQNNLITSFPAI